MQNLGKCKLCLLNGVKLLESHFMPRKLYHSGKKTLEFVSLIDSGFNPEEFKAPLLCQECEKRFNENGENEVLKHVAPKFVLKSMPLAERMKIALPRDRDPTAPRYCADDFDIDTDKFAYFALSMVWRRTIHQWHPSLSRWELGEFAEDMRAYLVGETLFPSNTAVIVLVCDDKASRQMWTIPSQSIDEGCLNFAFDVRGIRFRVMMGHLPQFACEYDCRGPLRPIYFADCSQKTQQAWDDLKAIQIANRDR
jgi:hypothetical protein